MEAHVAGWDGGRPQAVILDLDGTLIDTEELKQGIFPGLWTRDPALLARIDEYNRTQRGSPRRDKIEYVFREILGDPLDGTRMEEMLAVYAKATFPAVVAAPWMLGGQQFLELWSHQIPLHLASNNPAAEVRQILQARGMDSHFVSATGWPETKAEAVRRILVEGGHDPRRVLFVGDSRTDLTGARDGGVCFVAIVPPGRVNPFAGSMVDMIPDLDILSARLDG